MYGLPVRSVLYLAVFAFMPSGHGSTRQHVSNTLKSLRQEAGRLAAVVRAMNLSAVGILDTLKRYEESLITDLTAESSGSCSKSIETLLLRLLEGKIDALQMIDASSVYPSGLLEGNIWDFGSYDECLLISVDEKNVQFVGKHCFVDLQLRFKTVPIIDPGELKDVGHLIHYWFSICMPSTCNSDSLGKSLGKLAKDADDVLKYFNYSIEIVIDEANCHTQHSPPLTGSELFGIVLTSMIVGVAVMCTVADMAVVSKKYGSSQKEVPKVFRYVMAFSMHHSGKRLLDTRVKDDTVQGVHFLKFIGVTWIAASYWIKIAVLNPLSNLIGALDFVHKWATYLVLNVPCATDMFFLTSGILNTYSYFSSRNRRSVMGYFNSLLHRYIRLSPAYAVMILVTATWMYRLQTGPMWNIIIGEAKRECDQYWWSGLLYVNNYYNPAENCMFQSWYLAVEMHLFLLSPLVLYCLWRWLRFGLFIIALLISYSVITPFYVTYDNEFRQPVVLSYDVNAVNKQLELLYMPTHTNTISYVLGILCGYILFQVKKRKAKLEVNLALSIVLWAMCIGAMYWALFGDFSLYQFDTVYNKTNVALFTAFYRLVWSLAIIWVIVACNTGHGGPLGTFLSLKMWIPLGRISYCIFLTHAAVLLYGIGSMRQPMYFGYMSAIVQFLGYYVIILALAVLLCLTVEYPAQSLEKRIREEIGLERRSNIEVIKKDKVKDIPCIHLPSDMRSKQNNYT